MKRACEIVFLVFLVSLATMRPNFYLSGVRVVPADFVFPLLALIVAIAAATNRIRFRFDSLYWPIAAYLGAMSLATMFSEKPTDSLPKLAGIFYLAAIAFVAINLIDSPQKEQRAAKTWIIASTVSAAIGAITVVNFYVFPESFWTRLFLHHYGSLPPGNYPRVQGTFVYPAMLCNYFTITIALLFGLYSIDRIRCSFFIFSLALHSIAAIFTLTPGLGGLILIFAIYLGQILRMKGYPNLSRVSSSIGILISICFIIIAAFSFWRIATSPYRLDIAGLQIDPTQRLLAWQQAAETFFRNPIIGRGVGAPAANVIFKAPSGQMQLLTDAHQSWLNIAAQAGFLGLAAFIWLTIALFFRALRAQRAEVTHSAFRRWLFFGFLSAFLYQGLVGSFEDARHLWGFIGFLAAGHSDGNMR